MGAIGQMKAIAQISDASAQRLICRVVEEGVAAISGVIALIRVDGWVCGR